MFGTNKQLCEFHHGRTWDLLCEPLPFRECQIVKLKENGYSKAQIGFFIRHMNEVKNLNEMFALAGFDRLANDKKPVCIVLRGRRPNPGTALLHDCILHNIETDFYPADSCDISRLGLLLLNVICMDCEFF